MLSVRANVPALNTNTYGDRLADGLPKKAWYTLPDLSVVVANAPRHFPFGSFAQTALSGDRTNWWVVVFQTAVPNKKPEMYASPDASTNTAPGPTPTFGMVDATCMVVPFRTVRLPGLTKSPVLSTYSSPSGPTLISVELVPPIVAVPTTCIVAGS